MTKIILTMRPRDPEARSEMVCGSLYSYYHDLLRLRSLRLLAPIKLRKRMLPSDFDLALSREEFAFHLAFLRLLEHFFGSPAFKLLLSTASVRIANL